MQYRRRPTRVRRVVALGGLVAVSMLSCQLFVDSEVAGGIGAPCDRDVDCQAAKCIDGTCALECKTGSDCPEGTICSASKLCQLSFGAAWVFASDPANQGDQWEQAQLAAVAPAQAATPFLTQAKAFVSANPGAAGAQIDAALAEGYTIVFATSPEIEAAMAQRAQANPTIHFITAGGVSPGQNRSSLSGRQYKSWYLAGIAAASKATHKRLGMIASYVTPSVVANTNAFLRGAQSVDPDVVVEVRWTKVYSKRPPDSPSIETKLAGELLATDCDVVAHQSFDGFAVDEVEKEFASKPGIWSIGNNLSKACEGKNRCLGTVYWNWAPLYAGVLAAIHSNQFAAGGIQYPNIGVDPASSVPNFQPGPAPLDPPITQKIASERQALAQEDGVGKIFQAPAAGGAGGAGGGGGTGGAGGGGGGGSAGLAFTDGSSIAPGVTLSGDELRGLCRFLVGVVEKTDPTDPTSADKDALVPEEGDCTPAM